MNDSDKQITENSLDTTERLVADVVADEILAREKQEKKVVLLFLLLFVVFVFILSYLIFSRFAIYSKNEENAIQSGSIVFSYEEGTNKINIKNATAIPDEVGKALNDNDNFFEFNVAIKLKSKKQTKITYEISLTQKEGTLDSKYVRVLLVEDGKEVVVNGNTINTFSDLKFSKIRPDSRFLYKKEITSEIISNYVFKMWVGNNYELDTIERTFSCFVNIDAY